MSVAPYAQAPDWALYRGHVVDALEALAPGSVHCAITSPPYLGVRDYGLPPVDWPAVEYAPMAGLPVVEVPAWRGCLGMEPTPLMFVGHLVHVFRALRRALRPEGTLWLNLGDSYNGSGGAGGDYGPGGLKEGQPRYPGRRVRELKPKDLIGIPWRAALALQADGWWLRSDIIAWEKPNAMPQSVPDRPPTNHEYIFPLAPSARYYYDRQSVREANLPWGDRTIWTIPTEPGPGWHFATYPESLVEPIVLQATSPRVCSRCGAPWWRIMQDADWYAALKAKVGSWHHHGADLTGGMSQPRKPEFRRVTAERYTTGWRPGCTCNAPPDMRPDDLEWIASPTGRRIDEDPSLRTGRAGFNRPRNPEEGVRWMTRYEQRRYAEQLRNSPHRAQMEAEAGAAFAHYIRTDARGARPVPPSLLDAWLERGWLTPVTLPEWDPPPTVPATVLDPFAGSGTTLKVAVELGRKAVGIELSEAYCGMIVRRMSKAQSPLPLEGVTA